MSVIPPNPFTSCSLLQYFKSRICDDQNVLFNDTEYERYLELAAILPNRRQSWYAYGRKKRNGTLDGSGIYSYQNHRCQRDTWLMDVEIETLTPSVVYRIDEGALRIVVDPATTETRANFEVTGVEVCIKEAMRRVFVDGAARPTKASVYLSKNGFTVDSRDAARAMREHAQQICGVSV